jgi:spermidine synthase
MINPKIVIIGLFGLSGATALTYEVLWNKYLSLLLGNSVSATATTLAVFMGGMAIGSYMGGRVSERIKRNISLYGIIEGIIGIYCMMIPALLNFFKPLLALTYNNGASPLSFGLIRFMVLALILLLPASFMGMTFPILGGYLSRKNKESGSLIGFLYGFNCLGAVGGALAASFFLIPLFGQTNTALLAGMVNLFICSGALVLDRLRGENSKNASSEILTTGKLQSALKRVTKTLRITSRSRERSVAIVCAGGGMTSMLYQIGWTRTFALLFGSSVYTFSLIIAIFIGGLALGSFLISFFLPKIKNHLKAIAVLETLAGLSGLAVTAGLASAPTLCTSAYMLFNGSFIWATIFKTIMITAVCIVPTIFMGTIIPLASAYFAGKSAEPGQAIGNILSANTAGCIIGALVAGFVIAPVLGLKNTLIIGASINILLGLYLLNKTLTEEIQSAEGLFNRWAKPAIPLMTVATVIITIFIPSWDQSMLTNGSYLYSRLYNNAAKNEENAAKGDGREIRTSVKHFGKILYNQSGPNGVITVREMPDSELVLQINGKADASTGKDMVTQILLGHLPALLAPETNKMLVVGLGSGATLGALQMHNRAKLHHKDIENYDKKEDKPLPIDCVEISHEIVEASKLFAKHTGHSLKAEEVNMIEDDGRTYLSLTNKNYDLIVSEPSNPWISGMTNLFTREYFDLCNAKLEKNGLMCQWVQGYNMSHLDFASILKSFQTVFPETTIWKTDDSYDYILLGHKSSQSMDIAEVSRRLQNYEIAKSLETANIKSAGDLLEHYIGGPATVAEAGRNGSLITDDNLLLEYSAPQSLYSDNHRQAIATILARASRPAEMTSILRGEIVTAAINGESANLNLAKLMDNAKLKLEEGELLASLSFLYEALEISPDKSEIRQTITQLLSAMGNQSFAERDYEAAENYYEQSLTINPSQSTVHNSLGNCLVATGDDDTARYHYAMAINFDQKNTGAWINMAVLSERLEMDEESISAYEKAIESGSKETAVYNNLAKLYGKNKRLEDAEKTWKTALIIDPHCEAAKINLEKLSGIRNAG